MWTEVHFKKPRKFVPGEVIHLRVKTFFEARRGSKNPLLEVDDVTPLPGAEPPGYACFMCGIVENAKPDGSLPEGWTVKEFGGCPVHGVISAKGSHFVCGEEFCQKEPMCKVCGCTQDKACDPPCHWVEPDLCSTCAPKGRIPKDVNVLPMDEDRRPYPAGSQFEGELFQ